ncbi:hypothetical protein AB7813_27140 [Tardiphaga sp. 20_F10_N6_6]|uniref:hypothetical protein n=1 Tax=Tardiphaga sp. 20_F10_N6_6 TaxID=3240788 RepID=UPI003F888EDD
MNPRPSPKTLPPDFNDIRRYLSSIDQRKNLGRFIKAKWTPAELSECARDIYLAPGRTYPTKVSYQLAMTFGPTSPHAKALLAILRAPGFKMPPFNRPVPKRYEWDDPDNSDHTPEIRSDVDVIARLYRDRQSDRLEMPRAAHDEPVPKWLWRRAYRLRNRYHSLEDTLDIQGLREPEPPAEELSVPTLPTDAQSTMQAGLVTE